LPKTAPTSTDLLTKKSKCACTIVMHFLNISSKQVAQPTPGPEKLGDKMRQANRVHPQRSSNPLLKPAVLCCRKPNRGSSWQSSWFANSSFLVVACSTGGSRAGARPCWVLSTHPKNPLFPWGDWKSSQIISDSYVKFPKTNVRLATRIIS
jgi:hypothetical protein